MAWNGRAGRGVRARRVLMFNYAQMNAGPLGAALVGLVTFLALYGPAALDPTRIRWLTRDDFSQHLLGCSSSATRPWACRWGAIPGYVHPLGTTLGYTDLIPWAGLLLRPLSGLLPADFQYIGPWLCLCLMLQGAVAAWVARRLGATAPFQWLTGALLVLSPALLARMEDGARGAVRPLGAGSPGGTEPSPPAGRARREAGAGRRPRALLLRGGRASRDRRDGAAARTGALRAHRAGGATGMAGAGAHRRGEKRGLRPRAVLRLRLPRHGRARGWQ